ncbi:MAG: M55 family metallopeptidase [Phycisphaerae bacterium]
MRFYVSSDIEGMSGYGHPALSDEEIQLAHMAAVSRGLMDGGAEGVTLTSFHGIPQGLPPYVTPIRTRGPGEFDLPQFSGEYAGLVLLGFHGVWPGCYGHCYKFTHLRLNGRVCGEVTIQMMLAADAGVPTVLMAGDDRAIAEARWVVPDLPAVRTRWARFGDDGPLDPAVMERIRRAAAQCAAHKMRPVKAPAVLTLEVPFRTDLPAEYAAQLPYQVIRHGLCVTRRSERFAEIYAFLLDCFDCVTRARKVEQGNP